MSRPRSLTTLAIVLNRRNYGEADRILTLLTADQGKLSVIAKGSRKLSSTKRAFLEPGNLIRCQLVATKGMAILSQAQVESEYALAKQTLPRLRQLSQVLEIVDRMFVEGEEDSLLFNEVITILELLNQTNNQAGKIKTRLSYILSELGYQTIGTSGSLLQLVEEASDKPMRSWQFLAVK